MTHRDGKDDIGYVVWTLRQKVIDFLCRYARVPVDLAEDAASEGMMKLLNEIRIETATASRYYEDDELYQRVCGFAKTYIGQQQHAGRHTSLETPIGESDDGTLTLGMLAVARSGSANQVEDYCDAMAIARAANTLNARDRDVLLTMADGLTAEQAAIELNISPPEVRRERTRIIARVNSVKRAQR